MFALHHKTSLRASAIAASLTIITGTLLLVSSSYVYAKAIFAQYLIAHAWENSSQSGLPQPPWPWADTYPVAKLNVGGEIHYILAGATGRTLAFGPGHMSSTALPGTQGNAVITGHRDTHFSILESIQVEDIIYTETANGQFSYRVTEVIVVHETQTEVTAMSIDNTLTLITCYPFNSLTPNPEFRYVIKAVQNVKEPSKD